MGMQNQSIRGVCFNAPDFGSPLKFVSLDYVVFAHDVFPTVLRCCLVYRGSSWNWEGEGVFSSVSLRLKEFLLFPSMRTGGIAVGVGAGGGAEVQYSFPSSGQHRVGTGTTEGGQVKVGGQ